MIVTINIGVIGDFDPKYPSHLATNEALKHTAGKLGANVATVWIPTKSLARAGVARKLGRFDGLWASGGDYRSEDGVLAGIKYAREHDRPFIGT